MRSCIWLIGGTSESAELANSLTAESIPYVVSVTTEAAVAMYPPAAQVWVGKLTRADMPQFVQRWQVRGILDASHPFAGEVSAQAIAFSQSFSQSEAIAYLRYERSVVSSDISSNTILIDSIEALLESDILTSAPSSEPTGTQRILFTIGYRALSKVRPLRQTAQLFARILPSQEAVSGAIAAGFSSKEIMAIRPPVSPELEAALWKQWNITHVVAKASGQAGGESVKRAIADELGVVLILLRRPQLIYPNQTNSIAFATEFCAKTLRLH